MSERLINIIIVPPDESPKVYSYMIRGYTNPDEVIKTVEEDFKQMIQAWNPTEDFEKEELDLYAEKRFYFNDDSLIAYWIVLSNI